jgi:hypothetical protein
VQNDTPELPEYILSELPNLPRHGDRKTLAPIITKLVFPVSHRSLEIWPLRWRFVNGAAPAMMNGRGRSRATRRNKPSHADFERETAA